MASSEMALIERDLKHIWHPASQMKDYECFKPLVLAKAKGSYIELSDGTKIIDAISSWWCKSLGHGHPRLKKALLEQVDQFEHIIFANTTHETIVKLSEALSGLTQSLNKIFYAGDGSCAVEIAMKMSLQARHLQGNKKKTKFIALENAYHGETMGALSVSDLDLYRAPYDSFLPDTYFIQSVPYVLSQTDPLWFSCEEEWHTIEKQLTPLIDVTTAIIVEPIVQGAGGMKIYSQALLKHLREWTKVHDIHLIADEIMTGISRTGKMLACEHANIEPDFLCLSKGLTSGWMPFSAVLTRDDIYELFYDDYTAQKSFLHSHTYSGNAMAASIALEVLTIMKEDNMCQQAETLGKAMLTEMQKVANATGLLENIRQIGAITAADLIVEKHRRAGYQVFQHAVKLGALLRPLGNTIYWLPPLTTSVETIQELGEMTTKAITKLHEKS